MAKQPSQDHRRPGKDGREERLKAALKANIARRKAQARARKTSGDDRQEQS